MRAIKVDASMMSTMRTAPPIDTVALAAGEQRFIYSDSIESISDAGNAAYRSASDTAFEPSRSCKPRARRVRPSDPPIIQLALRH